MSAAEEWSSALARQGFVEIPLRRRKVATTLFTVTAVLVCSGVMGLGVFDTFGQVLGVVVFAMVFCFALMPHLEVVTATGPPLRIDASGIRIARWKPVHVPWDEVVGVRVHANTKTQENLVIRVVPEFFDDYQRSRLWVLRVSDVGMAALTGAGFSVPATVDADPGALAEWLDGEVQRRCPS
ncbi:hypothetical protein [Nocardioides sp.]|uniref:hypothetical protein n=1 Tax=Nocardioides sp. TaxID=35761 RepID=UPI002D80F1B2|nr:hypothetical protein [Nocardioides sp.]HET8961238.1 hypothetical protein [Nocardioides sp.]